MCEPSRENVPSVPGFPKAEHRSSMEVAPRKAPVVGEASRSPGPRSHARMGETTFYHGGKIRRAKSVSKIRQPEPSYFLLSSLNPVQLSSPSKSVTCRKLLLLLRQVRVARTTHSQFRNRARVFFNPCRRSLRLKPVRSAICHGDKGTHFPGAAALTEVRNASP